MCNPIRIGTREVEAHLVAGRTLALARDLAEAVGGLVLWDVAAQQAVVRPALAPPWYSLPVLARGAAVWTADYLPSQMRLDHLWARALLAGIDPLLMVAILGQEGTGSFDTNPANASQYNGNGPDANWQADVARAVGHVRAKFAAFPAAVVAGFKESVASLGLGAGTIIQFVNWPGPLPGFNPTWGPYAQHAEWWRGVTAYYEEMGGRVDLLDAWALRQTAPAGLSLRTEAITDQADLLSDATGKQPRPGVVTRIVA